MQMYGQSMATTFVAAMAIALMLFSGAKTSENGATTVAAASEAWDAAFRAGEVDRLMERYTADAVSMPPGRPALVGRDAIAADFKAFFDRYSARHETLEPVRDVMADTAIERAEYTMEIHPDGGELISEEGKHIVVYSRGDDGVWRVKWEIWNAGR